MAKFHTDDLREVRVGSLGLAAVLGLPPRPSGLVIFAHGSGSGRKSPRNNMVAEALRDQGLGTLLLDLLTPAEETDRANVFDIELLASRLLVAGHWAAAERETSALPIGFFGASTGAGAALMAAAQPDSRVRAVVSRGGRPDLAGEALAHVTAPTLLIVGGIDYPVIDLNRMALAELHCEKEMVIVPGASHLFEEPGTLGQVVQHTSRWFRWHLSGEGA